MADYFHFPGYGCHVQCTSKTISDLQVRATIVDILLSYVSCFEDNTVKEVYNCAISRQGRLLALLCCKIGKLSKLDDIIARNFTSLVLRGFGEAIKLCSNQLNCIGSFFEYDAQ
jgi:hypothetical protein